MRAVAVLVVFLVLAWPAVAFGIVPPQDVKIVVKSPTLLTVSVKGGPLAENVKLTVSSVDGLVINGDSQVTETFLLQAIAMTDRTFWVEAAKPGRYVVGYSLSDVGDDMFSSALRGSFIVNATLNTSNATGSNVTVALTPSSSSSGRRGGGGGGGFYWSNAEVNTTGKTNGSLNVSSAWVPKVEEEAKVETPPLVSPALAEQPKTDVAAVEAAGAAVGSGGEVAGVDGSFWKMMALFTGIGALCVQGLLLLFVWRGVR